ncbi:MAG TPA: plastocyanin/azurin family copper-binding protein [Candidatus Eisenbacteria bacterium]|nr:plastocyanin/azurin family copper-binding protein [Candidatus Eisenbacteria bacterium]
MSRRGWLGPFAVFCVVVLAVVEAAAVAAASAPVAAVNYEFNPSSVEVSVGDSVVWTMSGDGHTVRSGTVRADNIGRPSDGPLDSGFKASGESYAFTFSEAAIYEYFCEVHPEQMMKGTITVVAAPASASAPAPIASAPSAAAVTPPATGGTPSATITPAVTPIGSGSGQSPTSDATPFVLGGIVAGIALIGLILALARRNR